MESSQDYILDFSEFHSLQLTGVHYENQHKYKNLHDGFYFPRLSCPFCNQRLIPQIVQDQSYIFDSKAWECKICGYWEVQITRIWHTIQTEGTDTFFRRGVLRKFKLDSIELPVFALNKYLNKNPKAIYSINTKKMEQLVQSVFSDFFNCNVKHCGQSHDGGVDLFMIDSDYKIPIQVKRREKPSKTESVSVIRDFLGAMMLNKSKVGYIVSTADHFSREAKEAAEKSIQIGLVDRFELIDINEFQHMFDLINTKNHKPVWHEFANDFTREPFRNPWH